jgi:hypothetical protein
MALETPILHRTLASDRDFLVIHIGSQCKFGIRNGNGVG